MKISQSDLTRLFVAMGVDTATGWSADKLEAKVNQDGGIARYRDADRVLDDPELEALYQGIVAAQADRDHVTVVAGEPEPEPQPESQADAPDPSVFGDPDPDPTPAAEPAAETPDAPAPPPASKPRPRTAGKKPAKEKKPVAVAAKPRPAARVTVKPRAAKPAAKKRAAHAHAHANGNGKAAKDSWNPHGTWDAYKKFYAKNPRPVPEKGVLATVVAELKAAGKGSKPKPVTKEQIVDVLAAKFEDRDPVKMATNLNNILPTGLRIEYGLHVWKQKLTDDKGNVSTGYYIHGDGRTPQPEQPPAEKSAPEPKAAKQPARKKAKAAK